MRRIQLYIPEEMDARLARESALRGMSKAALIRQLVERGFPRVSPDPLDALVGGGDGDPVDDIDEVVYGR